MYNENLKRNNIYRHRRCRNIIYNIYIYTSNFLSISFHKLFSGTSARAHTHTHIRTGCLYTRTYKYTYIRGALYDRDGYCNPKGRCLYTAGNYGIYVRVCACVSASGRTGNTNELYSRCQRVIVVVVRWSPTSNYNNNTI